MNDFATFLEELKKLERLEAELANVSTRIDDRRRNDLVDFRRKLSQQIAAIGRIGDSIFVSDSDRETTNAYRQKFSNMRSSTALHQAVWPAIRLGEAVAEHRASTQRVRDANREFGAWARAAIIKLEGRREP